MPIQDNTKGFVYFIGSREFGWYKIGKTRKPSVRLAQLGILLPFRVEMFALWRTSKCALVEYEMHVKYADFRINGEWFAFKRADAAQVIISSQPFDALACTQHEMAELSALGFCNLPFDHYHAITPEERLEDKRNKSVAFMNEVRRYLAERNLVKSPATMKEAKNHVRCQMTRAALTVPLISPNVGNKSDSRRD